MADLFIQACFAFFCTNAEMALLEEGFQAASDLTDGHDPGRPSPEFAARFPPISPTDPWSGLRAIFCDPDYPDFGSTLEGCNSLEHPGHCTVTITGEISFQPEPVAALIQRCCRDTILRAPIGFEWSFSMSKPVIGGFGGGWCAIHPDRIACICTSEMLIGALAPDPVPQTRSVP